MELDGSLKYMYLRSWFPNILLISGSTDSIFMLFPEVKRSLFDISCAAVCAAMVNLSGPVIATTGVQICGEQSIQPKYA